jgi:hypothetical protein
MNVNFELVTELQALIRRDFYLANKSLGNPTDSNPLMDGEFLKLDTAYKLVRAGDGELGWAVFMEKGRYDVQALGKTTILFAGTYEADTRVFTTSGLTLGGKLQVSASVTVDSLTKTGLANYSAGEVVGYVTRLPANNGGKLRFIQTMV